MPAVMPCAAVPLDARADRARRGRAPGLQDITGLSSSVARRCHNAIENRGEQRVAIDRPAKFALDRRGARGHVGRIGRGLHVDADADHRRPDRRCRSRGPRQGCRRACDGRPSGRSAISDRRPVPTPRPMPSRTPTPAASVSSDSVRGARRPGDQRKIQSRSGWRRPRRSAPAAAGGLLVGGDHHAVRRAVGGQRRRHIPSSTGRDGRRHPRRQRRRRSPSRGFQLEAQIGGGRGMRQRADRHEVARRWWRAPECDRA